MKIQIPSPSFAPFRGLLPALMLLSCIAPVEICQGANHPVPKEGSKEEDQNTGEDDTTEPDAGNTDCDGSDGTQDPTTNSSGNGSGDDDCDDCEDDDEYPDEPSCIKETVALSVAPNEPGLENGILQLYINGTASDLGSRHYIEYYAVPQMHVGSGNNSGGNTDYNIVQEGGSVIPFKIGNGDGIPGKPTGASGFSQARLSFVGSGGAASNKESAVSLRHFRGSNGFGDYPVNGGTMTKYETRYGRAYQFPLAGMEVIRDKHDGSLVVNGVPGDGHIRQVKTAAGLLDIVTLTNRSYEVRKYAPAQIGNKVAGLYTVTSEPTLRMKVEAPIDTQNKLIITRTTGSRVTVSVNTCTIDGGTETWRQVVTLGGFVVERDLSRAPNQFLGEGYFSNIRKAKLVAAPAGGVARAVLGNGEGAGSHYALSSTSKGYAPLSSKQSFAGSGAVKERDRSYARPAWDANGTGRPETSKSSTGTQKSYNYESDGKMSDRTFLALSPSGGGDGGSAPASRAQGFDYSAHGNGEVQTPGDFRPRTTTTRENGQIVSKRYFSARTTPNGYTERSETVTSLSAAWGNATNRFTQKDWYATGTHKGRISHRRFDDGSIEKYEYASLPGNGLQVTTCRKLDSAENPVAGYSTRKIENKDARGWPTVTTNAAWVAGSWVDYETINESYDNYGNLTLRQRVDPISGQTRTLLQQEWDGFRLTRGVDEKGVATSYTYFEGGDIIKSILREEVPAAGGFPAQPEILTTYSGVFTLNADQVPEWDQRLTTITSGGLTLTEAHKFDHKGRVLSHTDKNGLVTTTSYTQDDKLIVVTLPDGGTKITAMDSHDRILRVTGTAVVPEFYHYQVRAGGGWIKTTYLGQDNGPRFFKTHTDAAGRTLQQSRPSFGGGALASTAYSYQTSRPGLASAITRSGEATRLSEFNPIGESERSALSADDTSLDLASATDRIVDEEPICELDSSGLWKVTRRYVYPTPGSAARKLYSTARRKMGGFTGTEIARSDRTDIALNTTSRITNLSGAIETSTTTYPAFTDTSVSTYHADRLVSQSMPGITAPETYGYDALGREVATQDPRHTQPSLTSYIPGKNQISSATDAAGHATSYSYYQQGERGAGEIRSITLADNSVSWRAYTQRGELMASWGSQTNPTWREYDILSQLTTLHTWQTDPAFDAGNLPATPPAGSATTTWNYDPATGLLASKRDADSKGADYQYDIANRLATRTWARTVASQPLTTTYQYTGFSQLSASIYSDNTPDTSHSYDRLGRITASGNTISTSQYAYNPATLLIDTETVSHDINADGTPELARVIDRSQDTLLRPTGFQLKIENLTLENSSSYTYSAPDGRLDTVSDGANAFSYTYLPNSHLVESVTGPAHTVTNSYEQNRDDLFSKENKVGITLVSGYSYDVNSIGQRTDVSETGSAFAAARSVAWEYDSLGQVVKADSTIPGLDRAYQYDLIGNRVKSADSLTLPAAPNYTTNALNQYSSIQNPQSAIINPAYDADGNATAYPLPADLSANSTLVWDAENRMISSTVGATTTNYQYDTGSRRIAKTTNGATTLYIYDGWNPIAEYSSPNLQSPISHVRSFLWGTDLSGSAQGAGGVGGLLLITDHSALANFFPTYDGNGNVSEYLDSTGAVVAHYEYDPFGRTTVATGTKAQDFSHRFSTKPLDPETGLYYYGYRYYDPVTGRWLSRDPIQERGGVNLYGFVGNDGVNRWDYLGLWGKISNCTKKQEATLRKAESTAKTYLTNWSSFLGGVDDDYLTGTFPWLNNGKINDYKRVEKFTKRLNSKTDRIISAIANAEYDVKCCGFLCGDETIAYNIYSTKTIVFCDAYFDQTESEKISTFPHEISHLSFVHNTRDDYGWETPTKNMEDSLEIAQIYERQGQVGRSQASIKREYERWINAQR